MTANTEFHSGGWFTGERGDFTGKPPYEMPTDPITDLHRGGWFMQLYGDFSGKPPFEGPPPSEGAKIPVRPVRLGTLMIRG